MRENRTSLQLLLDSIDLISFGIRHGHSSRRVALAQNVVFMKLSRIILLRLCTLQTYFHAYRRALFLVQCYGDTSISDDLGNRYGTVVFKQIRDQLSKCGASADMTMLSSRANSTPTRRRLALLKWHKE